VVLKNQWLALRLCLVLAATAGIFLAIGASPAVSKAQAMPVVWSNSGNYVAGRYCMSTQCGVQYWIKNGTAFAMICYGDTTNQYVNYWSPRWFYGYFTLATGGWKYYTYVHSSQVYYQWWVPHC
jgi:hypothetical protein